jgi:hypothetical protein
VVVDEAEQVGLASADDRAVQRVPGPQRAWTLGLEAAERPGRAAVGMPVQPEAGEVALQGSRGGAWGWVAQLGKDHRDLRGSAPRRLALERRGQLQHLGGRAGHPDARVGDQRGKAASPPGADPAVKRRAAHPHPAATRTGMVALGQRAHQLTPLPG